MVGSLFPLWVALSVGRGVVSMFDMASGGRVAVMTAVVGSSTWISACNKKSMHDATLKPISDGKSKFPIPKVLICSALVARRSME